MKSITNGKTICAIEKSGANPQGFTLVEVVCALLILGVFVVPMIEINSSAWTRAANGNNIMTATDLARALLEKTSSDRETFGLVSNGEDVPFEEYEDYPGFEYRTMKKEVEISYSDNQYKVPGLYRITAEVKYPTVDENKPHSVILERFITVPETWRTQ